MKLIVEEDPDAQSPEDISHVYSGYAPLSVRLVQHFTKSGAFRSVEEVCILLPLFLSNFFHHMGTLQCSFGDIILSCLLSLCRVVKTLRLLPGPHFEYKQESPSHKVKGEHRCPHLGMAS